MEGGEVGLCPLCNSPVTERTSKYKCTNADCSFSIAKKIKSCRIPAEEVTKLLKDNRTSKPLWFLSSKGKHFEAYLLMDKEGKIEFEFIDYDKVVDDTPIGKCPVCGNDMIEKLGYFGCVNPECNFQIRKTILSQQISKEDAIDIITKGETKKLTNFWSLKKDANFQLVFDLYYRRKKLCSILEKIRNRKKLIKMKS